MEEKNLYIIAGCNGAGNTTASFTILPEMLNIKEFVNADEIAKGLSPFQPEGVALEAGRIVLHRINELLTENKSFAFETTLSTKSYKNKIREAKEKGYNTILLFFFLKDTEIAKDRVKIRVSEGGHNIEPEVIERRYFGGVRNLFDIYLEIVDEVLVFDNSDVEPDLIALKMPPHDIQIVDQKMFDNIKLVYGQHK
ncbi:zeta toxin family protein [Pinibacter aurantiacus]|uniref:Zeta toxin family protein n=1 Tax=Pinibacter aurantiacus TaxID=2851599 RepID=A0A9E2W7R1_9BACT|nr:zeta toxin family protein [Pinibacter aurantiacus]MBV4356732.1 zeta toxin family protein [Pinibacter aurantiacus]